MKINQLFLTLFIWTMVTGCALMTPSEVVEVEQVTEDVLKTVEQDIDKDIHK